MRRAIRLSLAVATAFFFTGCASISVEDAKFTRRATSLSAQKSDSAHCWRLAQKTNIPDSAATSDMVAGYVLFGVVGAVVASSSNEEMRKDPKNYHRRKVHEECMLKRGYKKVE